MIAAALYLSRRSFVNVIRRRLARLRQPKYLVGFVVGSLYLYWLVFRPRRPAGLAPSGFAGGEILGVALLGIAVALNWVFGGSESPFNFSLAETQFLFAAPLSRRQVLNFKILRSQLPLLLSAAVTALVFSGGHLGPLRLLRVIGLWLVYGTLQLHYAAMSLLRASLASYGVTGLRRRLGTLLVLSTVAALGWWGLRQALPQVLTTFQADPDRGFVALADALHTGVLGAVTWPLRVLVAPLLASDALVFVSRLPAALLVLAVHYVWVVRSSLAFEEAAVEHATRLARRLEALRQGRSVYRAGRTPRPTRAIRLRLAPTGPASLAILWKNGVGATRDLNPRTLLVFLVLVAASLGLATGAVHGPDLLTVMLLAFAGMALLFGPLTVRFDLRRDLEMLDVLKSYPVRGRQVVAGEVAAPVLFIGLVVWSCLLGAFAASASRTGAWLPPLGDRLAIVLALLPGTAAILLVLVAAQNAAVLLFPAWVSVGPDRAVGLEATGQRLLMMTASLVMLVIALLPAAVVGTLAAAGAHALGLAPAWDVALGTLVGSAVVAFEGVLVVHLLGGVFDRLEPAAVG